MRRPSIPASCAERWSITIRPSRSIPTSRRHGPSAPRAIRFCTRTVPPTRRRRGSHWSRPNGRGPWRRSARRSISRSPTYYRLVSQDGGQQALEQAQLGLKLAPANVDLLVVAALAQQQMGRWVEAADLLSRAEALDPRSVTTALRRTRSLLFLRRYDDALAASARGLQVAPTNLALLENRAMVFAAKGDLSAAQATISSMPSGVDPAAFVAYVAGFYEMFWLLDDTQRTLLYQLRPVHFDDNVAGWALALAGAYALQGDRRRERAYADSARADFEVQLRATPDDAQLHALLGVALAHLGRKSDAIREGMRGGGRGADLGECLHRTLLSAPARADLHHGGRTGESDGPARAAAPGSVLPLARVAPDRPHVRSAEEAPAVSAAGGGRQVGAPSSVL